MMDTEKTVGLPLPCPSCGGAMKWDGRPGMEGIAVCDNTDAAHWKSECGRLRDSNDSLRAALARAEAAEARVKALEEALREVMSVSDRKTDIYDRARAVLEEKPDA